MKDDRIGGHVRYVLRVDEAPLMAIPPQIPKCILFVMLQKADGSYTFKGTAFLVSKESSDLRYNFAYAVTAKHVIDKIRDLGCDKAFLRFNDVQSGSFPVETSIRDCKFHPDVKQSVDVAVIRLPRRIGNEDHLNYPLAGCITDEVIRDCEVGLGGEVFFPGLFVHHFGLERNLPVLRKGTIAAMPGAPVSTQLGKIEAYLIEARSLGGLSGSPVFLDLGDFRSEPSSKESMCSPRRYHLLGLVHGHFNAKKSDPELTADEQKAEERINAGIVIVTPISKLLEVINQPAMLAEDRNIFTNWQRQTLPSMDVD